MDVTPACGTLILEAEKSRAELHLQCPDLSPESAQLTFTPFVRQCTSKDTVAWYLYAPKHAAQKPISLTASHKPGRSYITWKAPLGPLVSAFMCHLQQTFVEPQISQSSFAARNGLIFLTKARA
jgi:hypothetical protein